jgi:hypothetical protein
MGMVLGYNEVDNPADVIEIEQPGADKSIQRMRVPLNTGIAVVLPIWKVIEAMEHPDIKNEREAFLQTARRDAGRGFVPTSSGPLASVVEDEDANPDHLEDFTRLAGAASRKKPQVD